MNLFNEFLKIKKENSALFIKNYFPTEISWQMILDFVYKQASIDNIDHLEEEKEKQHSGTKAYGNLTVTEPLWITPQTGKIWEDFIDLKKFIYKLIFLRNFVNY